LINLLRSLNASGEVMITGGLAKNNGFVLALQELADNEKMKVCFRTHELSVFAGAIGTAIWGAFRHVKLKERSTQQSEGKKEVVYK